MAAVPLHTPPIERLLQAQLLVGTQINQVAQIAQVVQGNDGEDQIREPYAQPPFRIPMFITSGRTRFRQNTGVQPASQFLSQDVLDKRIHRQ